MPIHERILGNYKIESVTENGIEQIDSINNLHIDHLHFDTDNTYSGGDGSFWVVYTDTNDVISSHWVFTNPEKTQIGFLTLGCLIAPYVPIPFEPLPGFVSGRDCSSGEVIWEISKLSNSKMWLKITFNGNVYEVHLKKI